MDDGDGLTQEVASWRQLHETAMLEIDLEKLPKRIAEAQKAIEERVLVLARGYAGSGAEKDALVDAHVAMDDLKRIQQVGRRNSAGRVA
jgi:hypothetical protein